LVTLCALYDYIVPLKASVVCESKQTALPLYLIPMRTVAELPHQSLLIVLRPKELYRRSGMATRELIFNNTVSPLLDFGQL
jgi:hypothetical protein